MPHTKLNDIKHVSPEPEPTIASFSPVNRQNPIPNMSHDSTEGNKEIGATGSGPSFKYPYIEISGTDVEEHTTDDLSDDEEESDIPEELYDESEDDYEDDDEDISDPEQMEKSSFDTPSP